MSDARPRSADPGRCVSLAKRANAAEDVLVAPASPVVAVVGARYRYVPVQFVSGLRARVAEHRVRRWSPHPRPAR